MDPLEFAFEFVFGFGSVDVSGLWIGEGLILGSVSTVFDWLVCKMLC